MKKNKGQIIILLVMLITGGLCGFFGMMMLEDIMTYNPDTHVLFWFAILLIFLYLSIFLQIIVHECGHMIFGLFTGYRFLSLRIGPLMIVLKDHHFLFKMASVAGTAGQCLLAPPDLIDGQMPFVLYNLGGCIMNFLTACVAFLLILLCPHLLYFKLFCFTFGLIGIAYALINGIPLQTNEINNDGYNVKSLLEDPSSIKALWIQLKVVYYFNEGYRLKDMPESLFQLPSPYQMNHSLWVAVAIFKENRAMDMLDFDLALEVIHYVREHSCKLVGLYEHYLMNDEIYIQLVTNNLQSLDSFLSKEHQKMRRAMKTNLNIIRTDYAYEKLYLKDMTKASKTYQKFYKYAKLAPYLGDIESETELLTYVNDK